MPGVILLCPYATEHGATTASLPSCVIVAMVGSGHISVLARYSLKKTLPNIP